LRLADNPALHIACRRGGPVVPMFVWAPEDEGGWPPGGASRWWLHHSLGKLAAEFRAAGAELIIRRGACLTELLRVVKATGAEAVFWNRRYEPDIIARDRKVEEALRAAGVQAESCGGALFHEPETIRNKAGLPFWVFTPFWRTCLATGEPSEPLPAPRKLTPPPRQPASLPLAALELEPRLGWTDGLRAAWEPGSAGAKAELQRFLRASLLTYAEGRNRPDLVGTSRLSPHLHFGEISPRQVWHAVRRFAESQPIHAAVWRNWQFLTELG
jgi:deoxyribodipyrimidine photo-lyase